MTQNNATLATCVGEYLDAMPKEEINEHVFEATVEEAIDNIEVPAEGMEAPTPQPKE